MLMIFFVSRAFDSIILSFVSLLTPSPPLRRLALAPLPAAPMGRRAPAGSAASVYVSRLRRAFLLRVHPDRFRGESDKVKRQQAKLVQALSDRMAERDFLAYTASTR